MTTDQIQAIENRGYCYISKNLGYHLFMSDIGLRTIRIFDNDTWAVCGNNTFTGNGIGALMGSLKTIRKE
jgi:hypothetical protein